MIKILWEDWNNHVISQFRTLFEYGQLTDVTLTVGEKCINAHRVFLSVFSPILKDIFLMKQEENALTLSFSGVDFEVLSSLIMYIYFGQVILSEHLVPELFKLANSLQIASLRELLICRAKESLEFDTSHSIPSADVQKLKSLENECDYTIGKEHKILLLSTDFSLSLHDTFQTEDENYSLSCSNSLVMPTKELKKENVTYNIAYHTAICAIQVSKKYSISRLHLRRLCKQRGIFIHKAKSTYSSESLQEARQLLLKDWPFMEIQRKTKIPKGTLHRMKQTLVDANLLPSTAIVHSERPSSRRKSNGLSLKKAVNACLFEGMSLQRAARIYKVSKATLWRHMKREKDTAEL